jgi:GDP-L-fucose synthase
VFADDLAEACVVVMRRYDGPRPINLGGGTELTIRDVAMLVRDVVGYAGELRFDTTKPDGMPAKALDSTELLALGWRPSTPIREAISATYESLLDRERRAHARAAAVAPGGAG